MSTDLPGQPEADLHADDDADFDVLARRAGAALRRPAPEDGVRAIAHRHRRQQALKATVVGGVAVATLIGTLTVVANRRDPDSLPPVDSSPATLPATTTPTPTTTELAPVDSSPATLSATTTPAPGTGESAFAAAIDGSGVLTSPSANDVAQATDDAHYVDEFDQMQVSPTGNFVSLRRCRDSASATCGTGWAYTTGVAGGDEVDGGLLGEASNVHLFPLDEHYFVVLESAPGTQEPSSAWLIDAVSGQAGALRWRDEPTTLNSPEQALLLCEESSSSLATKCAVNEVAEFTYEPTEVGLPKVVDGRDGTIRPLAMPDNVVAGLPVAQHGTGRIWVGTNPDGDRLGLAYTDDGGATWNQTALPETLPATEEALAEELARMVDLLEIAAHGDRVAAAQSWGGDDKNTVYVSDDAGQSWRTATSEPSGNGTHLYVLADGRLAVMGSTDYYPAQLLASTGSDWAELDKVDHQFPEVGGPGWQYFSINRAGIALIRSYIDPCNGFSSCPGYTIDTSGPVLDTIDFSTDLTNWSTIQIPHP